MARSMQIKVLTHDHDSLSIALPLHDNHNHIGSLFGGSQLSCCAIACWAFLKERLERENLSSEIVIQKNESHFYLPVKADTKVCTQILTKSEWSQFVKTLKQKKRGRILLKAYVGDPNNPATVFIGHYVAKLKDN